MNLITVRGCNLEDRISNRSCVYNGLFINTGCEHGAILISSNRNVDSSISSGQLISWHSSDQKLQNHDFEHWTNIIVTFFLLISFIVSFATLSVFSWFL